MSSSAVIETSTVSGFFGKLPSRGDFVRAGLPRSFVQPWDDWLQQAIAGSRAILGERWRTAWMEAPIWRFALPAGQCGPDAVRGLWLPSVDAAGRYFPLTLACLGPDDGDFLTIAAAAGLDALHHDLSPEALAARLAAPRIEPAADPLILPTDGSALWWTDGSPFVPPTRLTLARLPDATIFAAMLYAADRDQPDSPPAAGEVRE